MMEPIIDRYSDQSSNINTPDDPDPPPDYNQNEDVENITQNASTNRRGGLSLPKVDETTGEIRGPAESKIFHLSQSGINQSDVKASRIRIKENSRPNISPTDSLLRSSSQQRQSTNGGIINKGMDSDIDTDDSGEVET